MLHYDSMLRAWDAYKCRYNEHQTSCVQVARSLPTLLASAIFPPPSSVCRSCAACRFPDTVGVRENNFYCRFNDKTLQAYSAVMHFTGALSSLPAGYVRLNSVLQKSCLSHCARLAIWRLRPYITYFCAMHCR